MTKCFLDSVNHLVQEHEHVTGMVTKKISKANNIQWKLNELMTELKLLRRNHLDQMEITNQTVEEMRQIDHETESIIRGLRNLIGRPEGNRIIPHSKMLWI